MADELDTLHYRYPIANIQVEKEKDMKKKIKTYKSNSRVETG